MIATPPQPQTTPEKGFTIAAFVGLLHSIKQHAGPSVFLPEVIKKVRELGLDIQTGSTEPLIFDLDFSNNSNVRVRFDTTTQSITIQKDNGIIYCHLFLGEAKRDDDRVLELLVSNSVACLFQEPGVYALQDGTYITVGKTSAPSRLQTELASNLGADAEIAFLDSSYSHAFAQI